MTLAQDQVLRAALETEILARLGAGAPESYTIGGAGQVEELQKTPLKDLLAMRDDLDARIAAATTGGAVNYAVRGDA